MKRVDPHLLGFEQDNMFIHLARYMFVARQLDGQSSVLEIGCGTGYGARLLADYAKEVLATDSDPSLEDSWKSYRHPNLEFSRCVPEQTYDAVVAFEVIEHIEETKLDDFFKMIISRTKKTGAVYISTPRALPFSERSMNRRLEHAKEYSPKEFQQLLKRHFQQCFFFAQNDAIISSQNLEMAWNMLAICIIG